MIVLLLIEQLLRLVTGIADTMMVSYAGEATFCRYVAGHDSRTTHGKTGTQQRQHDDVRPVRAIFPAGHSLHRHAQRLGKILLLHAPGLAQGSDSHTDSHKEIPHNAHGALTAEFQPSAVCKTLDYHSRQPAVFAVRICLKFISLLHDSIMRYFHKFILLGSQVARVDHDGRACRRQWRDCCPKKTPTDIAFIFEKSIKTSYL